MLSIGVTHSLNKVETPAADVFRRAGPERAPQIRILNGHAREWAARANGGDFSLKWAPAGRVRYRTERRDHRLEGAGLLLVNPGQPYELEFQARGGSETFCVFFAEALVRQAWASGPEPDAAEDLREIPNLVFEAPTGTGPRLAALRRDLADTAAWPDDLEARLLNILDLAVTEAKGHRRDAMRLGAVRPATRAHLLQRLAAAQRRVEADPGVGLDDLARASGVSKFHLLRLFRQVHGCTPMRYAQGLRLERAADALAAGQSLEDATCEAGYEAVEAFSRAFRRRFGVPPGRYRQLRNSGQAPPAPVR